MCVNVDVKHALTINQVSGQHVHGRDCLLSAVILRLEFMVPEAVKVKGNDVEKQ